MVKISKMKDSPFVRNITTHWVAFYMARGMWAWEQKGIDLRKEVKKNSANKKALDMSMEESSYM